MQRRRLTTIIVPIQNMGSDLANLTKDVKSISNELESTDPGSEAFREVFRIS